MKRLKELLRLILILALALSVSGCAFGGPKRIGKNAALQAALDHAGLTAAQVTDVDVELERSFRRAWYEVDFESGRIEYEYRVDAATGEILLSTWD